MPRTLILLPSFEKKLLTLSKPHAERIYKMINRLRESGMSSLKILDSEENYILAEMRSFSPPYRLYVVADTASEKYYLLDWVHKEQQTKAIRALKEKLSLAINAGLENVFGL